MGAGCHAWDLLLAFKRNYSAAEGEGCGSYIHVSPKIMQELKRIYLNKDGPFTLCQCFDMMELSGNSKAAL